MDLAYVAFFDGMLNTMSMFGKLSILENLGSSPNIKCIIDSLVDFYGVPQRFSRTGLHILEVYLVECGGKLLKVKRVIRFMSPISRDKFVANIQTVGFDVLEADLHSNPFRWTRVGEFGGHLSLLVDIAPSLCLLHNTTDTRRIASTSYLIIPIQSFLQILFMTSVSTCRLP